MGLAVLASHRHCVGIFTVVAAFVHHLLSGSVDNDGLQGHAVVARLDSRRQNHATVGRHIELVETEVHSYEELVVSSCSLDILHRHLTVENLGRPLRLCRRVGGT